MWGRALVTVFVVGVLGSPALAFDGLEPGEFKDLVEQPAAKPRHVDPAPVKRAARKPVTAVPGKVQPAHKSKAKSKPRPVYRGPVDDKHLAGGARSGKSSRRKPPR